jgi:putative RecB family exonuclease
MSNGITAWSYSRYADYKQCPLRFKLKYIDKMQEPGSPAMQRGGDIHKEGENYLTAKPGKGKALKVPAAYAHFAEEMEQLRTLDPMVEQQWGFTRQWTPTSWFGSDTWLRIVCDVVVKYDDDTVDLIDFKTGRKYDTNEEQVELFSCAPFIKWPEVEVVQTRLWYVDQAKDNEVLRTYTRDDFEGIRKSWEAKIVPMFKDKRFAPTPNDKCKWCNFSKAKGGPCKF